MSSGACIGVLQRRLVWAHARSRLGWRRFFDTDAPARHLARPDLLPVTLECALSGDPVRPRRTTPVRRRSAPLAGHDCALMHRMPKDCSASARSDGICFPQTRILYASYARTLACTCASTFLPNYMFGSAERCGAVVCKDLFLTPPPLVELKLKRCDVENDNGVATLTAASLAARTCVCRAPSALVGLVLLSWMLLPFPLRSSFFGA